MGSVRDCRPPALVRAAQISSAQTSLPGPQTPGGSWLSLVIPGAQRSLQRATQVDQALLRNGHNPPQSSNGSWDVAAEPSKTLTLLQLALAPKPERLADRHPEPLHWVQLSAGHAMDIHATENRRRFVHNWSPVLPGVGLVSTTSVVFIRPHTHGKGHCGIHRTVDRGQNTQEKGRIGEHSPAY